MLTESSGPGNVCSLIGPDDSRVVNGQHIMVSTDVSPQAIVSKTPAPIAEWLLNERNKVSEPMVDYRQRIGTPLLPKTTKHLLTMAYSG